MVRQDDLGQSHVRLDQVYEGVPVYGRQIITHLDDTTVRDITGGVFAGVRGLKTKPKLTAGQAIRSARRLIREEIRLMTTA
jgi:Zn-dependent metalloprotease